MKYEYNRCEMRTKFWSEKLKETDLLGDFGINATIILKRILQ